MILWIAWIVKRFLLSAVKRTASPHRKKEAEENIEQKRAEDASKAEVEAKEKEDRGDLKRMASPKETGPDS